jgi:hypothetical protein
MDPDMVVWSAPDGSWGSCPASELIVVRASDFWANCPNDEVTDNENSVRNLVETLPRIYLNKK